MLKLSQRKLIVTLGLFLLFASVPLASNQASTTESRYRFFVQAQSRAEVRRFAGWLNKNQFDIAGVNLKRGTIEVLTTDEGVKQLQAKGMKGRLVLRPVIGGRVKEFSNLDARYLDPKKVAIRMADLNARFPSVTRVVEIGHSLNKLPILALVISTTPDFNDPKFHEKPTVLVDGMHHAREVMTPEVVFDMAETILGAAKRVARARAIVEGMNVVLVPMLNVDGNTRVWNNDTMWRKNAHAEGSSVFGVDINRNYPFNWSACGGSSNNRSSQDYHGESAGSEPETQALVALAEKIHPMASLSYHSYSELVLYPFGCDGDLTGENALLAKLGKEMAALLPSDSGRGTYTPGTPWQILYSVDGDSMGHMFANYGAVAYTFEVNEEFQPSYELRDPTVKKQRVAWSYFFDQIQEKLATFEVRDSLGRPVAAELQIAQIPHTKGERDFQTNLAGNYFKVLLPGTYTVRAKTKSGQAGAAQVMMANGPQTVVITVQ